MECRTVNEALDVLAEVENDMDDEKAFEEAANSNAPVYRRVTNDRNGGQASVFYLKGCQQPSFQGFTGVGRTQSGQRLASRSFIPTSHGILGEQPEQSSTTMRISPQ